LLVVGDAVCLDLDNGPAMVAAEGALDSTDDLGAILRDTTTIVRSRAGTDSLSMRLL
jgi:hypothetical protein